jgi:hypothetical protein
VLDYLLLLYLFVYNKTGKPCLKITTYFYPFYHNATVSNAILVRNTAPLYLPYFPTLYLTANTHLPEGRAGNAWEYLVENFSASP